MLFIQKGIRKEKLRKIRAFIKGKSEYDGNVAVQKARRIGQCKK
jgi:hypothetical protein